MEFAIRLFIFMFINAFKKHWWIAALFMVGVAVGQSATGTLTLRPYVIGGIIVIFGFAVETALVVFGRS